MEINTSNKSNESRDKTKFLSKKRKMAEEKLKKLSKCLKKFVSIIHKTFERKFLILFTEILRTKSTENQTELLNLHDSIMTESTESIKQLKEKLNEHGTNSLKKLKKENTNDTELSYFLSYRENKKNSEINQKRIKIVAKENKNLMDELIIDNEKLEYYKLDLEGKLDLILNEIKILKNDNMLMKIGNMLMNLRKNFEYFIYFFFDIPQNYRLSNISNSLKPFFDKILDNFQLNTKKVNIIDKSEISLLNEPCSVEAEYKRKIKDKIKTYHQTFEIKEDKLRSLILFLLRTFKDFENLKKQLSEIKDQYSLISSEIHFPTLTPVNNFITFSQEDQEKYIVALKITEFCEGHK